MDKLGANPANSCPLTPLGFLERAATVFGDCPSVVYHDTIFTWNQTFRRCLRLASALVSLGISGRDVVSVLLPNVPAMYEVQFGVPMSGAVLNSINTLLDARTIAVLLRHSGCKVIFIDPAFLGVLQDALRLLPPENPVPRVILVEDPHDNKFSPAPTTTLTYERLLEKGDSEFDWVRPESDVPRDGFTMGEIVFRGGSVMLGYFKDEEATKVAIRDDRWFYTGDIGVMHPDGYLEIRDRSKDVIICGGENISSVEVESVLYGHPMVKEAAVVACPNEFWGETPCAFVSPKDGAAGAVDAAEVIAWCRERMPRYMVPRTLVFRDELPKTSTGKIQKYKLRNLAKEMGMGHTRQQQ
ncbi:unnamed protein product [Alopecurus aequalis]